MLRLTRRMFLVLTGATAGTETPDDEVRLSMSSIQKSVNRKRQNLEKYSETDLVSNPVLSAKDVTDYDADFIADPFILFYNRRYHLFFEISAGSKVIGHATSPDGYLWDYDQAILTDGKDLSYPIVFFDGSNYIMTPANDRDEKLKIYISDSFPSSWSLAEAVPLHAYPDPTPFYISNQSRWYLVAGNVGGGGVRLWYADRGSSFTGRTWTEHPDSPLYHTGRVKNVDRPGGRPIVYDDGRVDLMFQNSSKSGVIVRRLLTLSPNTVVDAPMAVNPIIEESGVSETWNADDMHHIDIQFASKYGGTMAVVDGHNMENEWSIGIYD